jgi:hypothetical protein
MCGFTDGQCAVVLACVSVSVEVVLASVSVSVQWCWPAFQLVCSGAGLRVS